VSDVDGGATRTSGLAAVSSLAEPTRRAVYELVVADGDWVSRERAAEALGLERGTAAHHLDRLAADGLLEVDYRRLSGRTGPGAGRPAKVYRRARSDFEVSLPPRDYELAGSMLAAAADRARADGIDIDDAVADEAAARGRRMAEEVRTRLRTATRRSAAARRSAVLDVLVVHGFEPRAVDDGTIVLNNCPFHRLAKEHTDLICNMNLCLLRSTLVEVGGTGFDARLEPEEDTCCVRLHPLP
jgi:predicted ArsR family transcriptional regulator